MSKDTTPISRNTATRSSDKTPSRCNNHGSKYKATTLWNNIIRHFRDELPVKRHRRQLTYFEDSFTGKEAVDFLMVLLPRLIFEGRQVDRSNCTTLLQKFLDQGFIKGVRSNLNEKDVFKDNATLYTFVDDCTLFGISRTPRLVRTGSCKEDCQGLRSNRKNSPDQFQFLRIETPPCNKGFNRRMSSSHGNLLSLLPKSHTEFDSSDSLAETIDSKVVEVNFNLQQSPLRKRSTPEAATILPQTEMKKTSMTVSTQRLMHDTFSITKNGDDVGRESPYEWLNFVKKKKSHTDQKKFPINRSSNMCKEEKQVTQVIKPLKSANNAIITHRYVTEVDSWTIWKNCLLSRLRRTLSVSALPFISWEVSGQDVKWNCQRVGASGIVKLRDGREDFSSYLMRLMRYLEQFPFPSGSANIVTYKDNQEVNVFKTVCSHLSRESPLLTSAEAFALAHIVSLYPSKVSRDNLPNRTYGCAILIETEFTEDAPRSRFVPRQFSNNVYGIAKLRFSRSTESLAPVDSFAQVNGLVQEQQNAYLLEGLPEYHEVVSLPGLKESPELMKRLDEMCLKPRSSSQLVGHCSSEFMKLPNFNALLSAERQCTISRSSGISSHSNSSVSETSTAISEDRLPRPPNQLLEALSLVLLALPTSRRRKLHYLIRFMNKIATNHCLQLNEVHSNRYVLLKSLTGTIISLRESTSLSLSQSIHLVSLFIDYEKEIFSVPKNLMSDVDVAIRERQRDKVTPIGQSPGLRAEISNHVQFCEPVKGSDYDDQNQHLVDNLLELLDQICTDENLTLHEKRKRLKKFKKTYPFVYSHRFPSPELNNPRKKERENRFLSKLFGR
ncbi:domain found in Dishevelled, Egl-10, and Pleckstrin [Dictyocaulus viviparus]|uniref:Domain found in Dishevelled, Egl-10, and Pleckstrin n=1 Tax=Dictyocaulus viviparus TaxID=29172 RepID=A0A0D8XXX3_DICVI|nr:domain found in Dishevelled, Egl-10, and Pleckstrin [Dictyocaulus viviparus]